LLTRRNPRSRSRLPPQETPLFPWGKYPAPRAKLDPQNFLTAKSKKSKKFLYELLKT
jgi:hypothetical protein